MIAGLISGIHHYTAVDIGLIGFRAFHHIVIAGNDDTAAVFLLQLGTLGIHHFDLFHSAHFTGKDQVRIAYVLKKEDLNQALIVLQKALEAYPGRTL